MTGQIVKPCPFCGSTDIGLRQVTTYSIDSSYDVFGCLSCYAGFVDGDVNDWNDRSGNAGVIKALQIAIRQNSHDMVMTGDELRICEAALAILSN